MEAVVERGILRRVGRALPAKTGKVFVVTTEDVWRHAGRVRSRTGRRPHEVLHLPGGEDAQAPRAMWKRWPKRWCNAAPTAPAW